MVFWEFLFLLFFGGPPVNCQAFPDGSGQVCQIGYTQVDTVQHLRERRR